MEEVWTATTGGAPRALSGHAGARLVAKASFAALAVIVKVTGVTDVPPPGAGSKATLAAPAAATFAAGTVARQAGGRSCRWSKKGRCRPAHDSAATKLVPVTVIENCASRADRVWGLAR